MLTKNKFLKLVPSFIYIIFFNRFGNTLKLPNGIKPCLLNTQNDTCQKQAVEIALGFLAHGNKQLSFPNLEPLAVKEIKIDGNGGRVNLNQEYYNLKVSGHTNTAVKLAEFTVNENKCLLRMESLTPSMTLLGRYRFLGRIFLLPINGNGPANITLVNMKAKHWLSCRIDGEFIRITQWKTLFDPEYVGFDLVNLFDGNAELSAHVLRVMQENNLEVFKSISKDYERTFGEIYASLANQIFGKIPYKHVFLTA